MPTNNNDSIQTPSVVAFRATQKFLHKKNVPFHTFNFPEESTLKIVLRDIPIDITEDEEKQNLKNRGFDIFLIRRFDTKEKPMPICMFIFKKTLVAAVIYNIISMLFLAIKVESYIKSDPSQYFLYQRFGNSSNTCFHLLRYVKCGGPHTSKDCTKDPIKAPSCCNCGKTHSASYRDCPYYKHVCETNNASKLKTYPPLPKSTPTVPLDKLDHQSAIQPPTSQKVTPI